VTTALVRLADRIDGLLRSVFFQGGIYMLVLKRHYGQFVDINGGADNGGISVCVTDIGPGYVRLGFQCGKEFAVVRREAKVKDKKHLEGNGGKDA
jgi:sRNA-binding carbon storage regulator CsrA